MADRLLLESGAPDGYQLEDGSGVLLKEVPPIAFVQALLGATRNTTGTSTVASGSVTVTAGNTIFVVAASFVLADYGTESVTDNLGNVYSLVTRRRAAGDSERCALYMAPVTVGGTMTTLTYNHDSSQFVGTVSAEYTNVGSLASTYTNDATSTTATWLGSTTIPASGLAVGGTSNSGDVNFTVGAANGTPSTTQVEADGWSTTGQSATIYHALSSVEVTGFTGSATLTSADWVGVGAVYSAVGDQLVPTTAALVLATFAPTVTVAAGNVTVTPSTATLALTSFDPVIALAVTPTTASLTLATFAPVIALAVIPTTATLALTTFAPTVTASDHKTVTPTTASLTTSTFAPTVATPTTVTPDVASLTLTTFAPDVAATAHQVATPTTASLVTSGFAPTVLTPVAVTPDVAALTLATFEPTVVNPQSATPSTAALTLTTFEPTVVVADFQVVTPTDGTLTLTTFPPVVTAIAHVVATPTTASLTISTFAPTVTATAHAVVIPGTRALVLTTFRPQVTATGQDEDLTWIMEPTLGHSIRIVVRPAYLYLTTYPPRVILIDDGDVLTLLQLIA